MCIKLINFYLYNRVILKCHNILSKFSTYSFFKKMAKMCLLYVAFLACCWVIFTREPQPCGQIQGCESHCWTPHKRSTLPLPKLLHSLPSSSHGRPLPMTQIPNLYVDYHKLLFAIGYWLYFVCVQVVVN